MDLDVRRLATALILLAATRADAQSFAAPSNVSQSASGSYLPRITRDRGGPSSGTMRIFWHDFASAPNMAWCSESSAGAFAPGAACTFNVSQSWTPRAASDSVGVTHVAWRDRSAGVDDILHATFDGLTWSAARNLSRSGVRSTNPVIALDPWDRPHVLWEEETAAGVRYFEAHSDGIAWSAPADSGLPYAVADTMRIACDGAGVVHAAWHGAAAAATDVFHAQRPDGGTWSAPENVSDTPDSYSAEPAIVVAPGGALHVAWVEQEAIVGAFAELCLASRPAGGGWSSRQELTALRRDAFHPALTVGADGTPRIAFASGPAGAREVLFLAAPGATPVSVSSSPGIDSAHPSLLLDERDEPWIAWQEGSPPIPEIFVAGPGGHR